MHIEKLVVAIIANLGSLPAAQLDVAKAWGYWKAFS